MSFRITFRPVDTTDSAAGKQAAKQRTGEAAFLHAVDRLPEVWRLSADGALMVWSNFINEVFDTEKGGNWAPLRRRTRYERQWLQMNAPMDFVPGYGMSHPILQRAGNLKRSLTDPDFPPQMIVDYHEGPNDQLIEEMHTTGANIIRERGTAFHNYRVHWATEDDRFLPLHSARGLVNTNARPMVPDSMMAFSPRPAPLFRDLEKLFVSFFEEFFDV